MCCSGGWLLGAPLTMERWKAFLSERPSSNGPVSFSSLFFPIYISHFLQGESKNTGKPLWGVMKNLA